MQEGRRWLSADRRHQAAQERAAAATAAVAEAKRALKVFWSFE
jgi:hypothetical protein